MNDNSTLFGIKFENRIKFKNVLGKISEFNEDIVFTDEKEVLEYLLNIDINKLHDFSNLIIKAINLNTSTKIELVGIVNAIYDYIYLKEKQYYKEDSSRVDTYYSLYFNETKEECEERTECYSTEIEIDGLKINLQSHSLRDADIENIIRDRFSILSHTFNYSKVGTDEKLSDYEKKRGVLNTISIVREEINTDDFVLKNTEEKTNHTPQNSQSERNQKLEWLIKFLKSANVNYVLKDDDDNFFYPFIANIFFTYYGTKTKLIKYKDTLPLLKKLAYENKKLDINIIKELDDEVDRVLTFSERVQLNQVTRYIATVYAHKHNTEYNNMRQLIEFLMYKQSKKNEVPIEDIPPPLLELDKFTKNI